LLVLINLNTLVEMEFISNLIWSLWFIVKSSMHIS
jgi:hypothetical protein